MSGMASGKTSQDATFSGMAFSTNGGGPLLRCPYDKSPADVLGSILGPLIFGHSHFSPYARDLGSVRKKLGFTASSGLSSRTLSVWRGVGPAGPLKGSSS